MYEFLMVLFGAIGSGMVALEKRVLKSKDGILYRIVICSQIVFFILMAICAIILLWNMIK